MKKLSVFFILFTLLSLCCYGKDGVLPGKFAIAEGRYIHFSQGNLQYQASTNTWRFAEQQWYYVGDATDGLVYENGVKSDNGKISSSYNGWIDLFGWGTSGWDSGAKAYQPWEANNKHADYYPGGDNTNNLTGPYANADWGVYNQISNGGNKSGIWRTLTGVEWQYLFKHHVRGQATVNGVHGYVLLPEGWSTPEGLDDFVGKPNNWTTNVYTEQQWQAMELAGAVFLPCAGGRSGSRVLSVGHVCHYWSASQHSEEGAHDISFSESKAGSNHCSGCGYGQSVRLVQDVK